MEPTEHRRILPSGKFILITLLILLAGGAAIYAYNTYFKQYSDESDEMEIDIPDSDIEDDFDQDGLLNWEEFLWKTDPQIADTDGDGTNDGEEVATGRDPLVEGPNDRLEGSVSKSTNIEVSATDRLAQEFAIEYFTLKQTNESLDIDTQSKLLQKIAEKDYAAPIRAIYSINDISTSPVSTELSLRKYGNDLGRIIIEASVNKPEGNELDVFTQAARNQDSDILSNLEPFIAGYKTILSEALETPVPKEAATLHLNFINSIHYLIQSIEGMQQAGTDPLLAMISINEYSDSVDLLRQSLRSLTLYLSEKGVSYQQTEYGFALFSSI